MGFDKSQGCQSDLKAFGSEVAGKLSGIGDFARTAEDTDGLDKLRRKVQMNRSTEDLYDNPKTPAEGCFSTIVRSASMEVLSAKDDEGDADRNTMRPPTIFQMFNKNSKTSKVSEK